MYSSAFFNSKNGDRMYKAESFAEYFASFIGNGVFPNPSSGLQVQQGDGMKIIVRPGRAWINGYFFHNQNDYVFTLDGADGVLRRIDRIVVRWSLPDREIILAVKKGNLSVTPVAPSLQRDGDVYELALADVTVNNGVVAITPQNITDLRLNSAYCGMAAGLIQQVDTTTIFNQYSDWFNSFTHEQAAAFEAWFASIQDILDENVAAQLLAMIQAITGKPRGITNDLALEKTSLSYRVRTKDSLGTFSDWVQPYYAYQRNPAMANAVVSGAFVSGIVYVGVDGQWVKAELYTGVDGQWLPGVDKDY